MEYRDPFATAQNNASSKAATYDMGLRAYMLKIYNYMASALALTGIVAMVFASLAVSPDAQSGHLALTSLGQTIFMSPVRYLVLFAPFAMVMWISFGINRMGTAALQISFWAFSALMGLSLSSLTLVYTGESIARAFFVTAGTFGAMSLYGYTTKRDLTSMGSFLFMGLIGVILASLVNMFLHSSALNFALTILGLFIFIGLTAWDTQKLKAIYYQVAGNSEAMDKSSVMGALNLYMDFINIFLYMLRIFGNRR